MDFLNFAKASSCSDALGGCPGIAPLRTSEDCSPGVQEGPLLGTGPHAVLIALAGRLSWNATP